MSTYPNVTIGSSTGAAALVTSLTSHFNGTSTKFALSSGVAYDAGDTLCIEPIADPGAATDWQINIRRTSTTAFKVQLDPSGTITDAGSTAAGPTGASSMSSYEDDWALNTSASPITWFLAEWEDAILFIARDTTDSFHYQGFHTGRVFVPGVQGVPGLSDGFGNMCGTPRLHSFSGGNWFSSGSGDTSVRVSDTGTQATDWSRYVIGQPAYSSTTISGGNMGGYYYPCPVPLFGSVSTSRCVGILKYLFAMFPADTADTRLEDPVTGTDRWLHITYSATPQQLVMPWPDATAPK